MAQVILSRIPTNEELELFGLSETNLRDTFGASTIAEVEQHDFQGYCGHPAWTGYVTENGLAWPVEWFIEM